MFKALQTLNKDFTHTNWKKVVSIWQAFTSVEKKKQAPAIFLTLTGQAREAVLVLDVDTLTGDYGVKNLIECLDQLFLKDETYLAYEAYETFENICALTKYEDQ